MKNILTVLLLTGVLNMSAQDTITTDNSAFVLHFLGHGTLYIEYEGDIIHIDPFGRVANYDSLPDADYILITHDHRDHFDKESISKIIEVGTKIVAPKICEEGLSDYSNVNILGNGDVLKTKWGSLKAVPAYNIVHTRNEGQPYHPKGAGNGYLLDIDNTTVYIAGDTENIPEMIELINTDIAFLPMNLPYTMTPQMVADATKMIQPVILYPYHYGNTDTSIIIDLLKDSGIDVRIRDMQ